MKPNKEGIWEWFDTDGAKRLVYVCNVGGAKPYLRVYWWGGYYNIYADPIAEWADRWGNYVGPNGSVNDDDLYLGPTPEQREKIMKQNEKNS